MASEEEILTQKPAATSVASSQSRETEIQVTTKDPKKVAAGKRLAEYNRKNREELKKSKLESEEKERAATAPSAAPLQEASQTSNNWIKNNSTLTYGGVIAVSVAVAVVGYKVWGNPFKKVSSNSNSLYSTPPLEESKSSTNVAENKFELK